MDNCRACGFQLGVGRFCLNCGTPIDADASPDTVARNARFPLYADEASPVPADPPPPVLPDPPAEATAHRATPQRQIAWLPVIVAALSLLLVASVGALLLLGTGGDESRPTASDRADASNEPEPTTSVEIAPTPTQEPTAESEPEPDPVEPEPTPQDLIRFAEPTVPDTAPPSQDTTNNRVRYVARNMIDGVPGTTWRMPGDATGQEITLTFPAPATLSRIGLINGYAKKAGRFDWYNGNRRIESVTWSFDDGSTVTQDFDKNRAMQSIDIDPVTTTTIRIRLDAVTAPGQGRAARNNTAISDVLLFGVPA